jgi:hypothetical protein
LIELDPRLMPDVIDVNTGMVEGRREEGNKLKIR